ncbi:adenosylcobyric acid synthase (glutamine-hydrolysing) [Tenacibaculum sp. MAR_2009_124]|uniref:cobyric acid synthase n=1 Tax=Tenacibaculum sp. MAR_2009_124 TaxID=1250059 RepID=UPI00089B01AB|nr:cobyric acid synthase [Tenacibaculum sp. MAR_2009_124]SEB87716.1 adenosylcobyric acid synthase (glutamine-hydrolysing) [Tenacibaculum sp. MAR_2009_124]
MIKKLRPLMFVGTGSDVGKSIVVTGICRLLKQKGYAPAPFKAQNMSLNSYVTKNGLEIGRAQAVQAEAAEIDCTTEMNPVLLKPSGKNKSQVILHGKPIGDQTARSYFLGNNKQHLFDEVKKAFDSLNTQYSPIVLEGAGSISELNLKHRDIVNMRMAEYADASVYLIADIDRGGVFASVYGSIALLDEEERKLIKGIIINKFRGDLSLFEDGKKLLEKLTNVPVLGVIPYAKDIYIEEEDSLGLDGKNKKLSEGKINIAVILLPFVSNFTDFNRLEKDERVHLFYTRSAEDLKKADIIIIPGSKNTIADMQFLRSSKLAQEILLAHDQNKKIVGICGGFQMLGLSISDPNNVENDIRTIPGLGIIPANTVLASEKTTKQCEFTFKDIDTICSGYEIHMGITDFNEQLPLNFIEQKSEGYIKNNCWGTYIHGIFDNSIIVDDLLSGFHIDTRNVEFDYQAYKEENYNKLAQHLEKNLNIESILKNLTY